MIKILHIVSALDAGGVETLLYTYYSSMNHSKFKFDIAITNDNNQMGIYYDKFKELGCKIYFLPSKKHLLKYHFALKKILKVQNYNIVHVHQDEMCFQSLYCAKKCKINVRIAHAHHNDKITNFKFRIFRKLTNKYCTHKFACSKDAGDSLFKNNDFYIMKNAIQVDKFLFEEQKRIELRKKYNFNDKLVVGTVARMVDQKNPRFAINVIDQLMKQLDNIVYVWIGDGNLYPEIKNFICNKNLQDKIYLLGAKTNINDYYNMLDIFFLPSKEEGLGISAVEAQCNGLPCVLSNGFPLEVCLLDDRTTFIDCNSDINVWVNTIINNIKYDVNNRNIRNKKVLEDYSIDKCVKKLENKYEEII